ncbi:hypothetical protein WR25_07925 [Diploscapter pachys]|uniref:C2 domain-containing protein n=1 Tax=Diploscapter pachys TaxID=2018661 RepID=A0A2A2KKG8_9BILA|nr:hypothetical protein WR25_07925 [Diploscapter pachys]
MISFQFPAVLHVKMWFGKRSEISTWSEFIEPAESKFFIEVFQNQRKAKLTEAWKPVDNKEFTSENMEDDMKNAMESAFGWDYVSNWRVINTHEMWVTDTGRHSVDDKLMEAQEEEDGKWKHYMYTDYYGGEINKEDMEKPPDGWEYVGKWQVDKNRNNGDEHGWIYCMTEEFWDDEVDKDQRPGHRYRRRWIKRKRSAKAYKKSHENCLTYLESLGDRGWEFASDKSPPYHAVEMGGETRRRRRLVVEVERKTNIEKRRESDFYFISRIYEHHTMTSQWQLRCYILWAKDLLPTVKNSSHAFIRVTFFNRCKQTLAVANSQNPVWDETIVLDKLLIPGGNREIFVNPPSILLEVRGERPNDTELFLGRFTAKPTVISSPSDIRAHPTWHVLTFAKGRTRGAILACFELFQLEDGKKNKFAVEPMKKKHYKERYEVPEELRPKFEKYAVQIMCWGVRSLSKYQLLSVRRPFIEMAIADNEFRTDPLRNVGKDPNFPEPMITFPEVLLPSELDLSPPLVLNLYDCRAFKRRPLIGNKDDILLDWDEFDDHIDEDENEWMNKRIDITISLRHEGMPRLDWWSRYYSSQGADDKAPGYYESGMEHLTIFNCRLEETNNYNYFGDFLDTFQFVKSSRGHFDDPEVKEKVGELKGKLFITRLGKKSLEELVEPPGVEFVGPVKCLLRVYVIEARNLNALRKNGICDPYILVKCGKKKVSLKKKYIADTTDPVFGEMVEFEVNIPVQKDLTVTIMDRRKFLKADEPIGETTIDLENRLLTKWRATVGLSRQYTINGEMPWRDQLCPMATLRRLMLCFIGKKYCSKMLVKPPRILIRQGRNESEKEYGIEVLGLNFWYTAVLNSIEKEEEELVRKQRMEAGKEDDEENEERGEKGDASKEKSHAADDGQGYKVDIYERNERMEYWEREETRRELPNEYKVRERGDGDTDTGRWTSFKKGTGTESEEVKSRFDQRRLNRYRILGSPLNTIALYVLNKLCLGAVPPPYDISPRQPDKYQLRVAVFNVCSAIPIKKSFNEPVNDLYVKVFVNGMKKADRTDVHYRSLDGMGEFNWRFLLNVDYNPWERKLYCYRKTRLFRKARDELVDPLLIIQLWDKNAIRHDKMLGEYTIDMTGFVVCYFSKRSNLSLGPVEVHDESSWQAERVHQIHTSSASLLLCQIYDPPEHTGELISLFETQSARGWWPMLRNGPPEQKDPKGDKRWNKSKLVKYKDKEAQYCMGLVEMEMCLVTQDEARKDPSPYLPKPHRSKWNYFWILSRFRPCCRTFWRRYGITIVIWVIFILLIALFFFALINKWPEMAALIIIDTF